MFQIGDNVVYGCHGVCCVQNLETRNVDGKKVEYLVLEPREQNNAKFYIPMHNDIAMSKLRPMLTRTELESILRSPEIRNDCWIRDENQRKLSYRKMIGSCDRVALLQMIYTLHNHKKQCVAEGKKFHLCDENFMRDAEKVLADEFSAVLEIPQAEVGAYICNALNQ